MPEAKIMFTCRKCGKAMEVPASYIGRKVMCKRCNESQTIPPPAETDAPSRSMLTTSANRHAPDTDIAPRPGGTFTKPGVKEKVPPLERRYRALRAVAFLCRCVGVISLSCGVAVLAFTISKMSGPESSRALMALVPMIGGWVFSTILIFASGESIMVLIGIEENSRQAAQSMSRVASLLADGRQP